MSLDQRAIFNLQIKAHNVISYSLVLSKLWFLNYTPKNLRNIINIDGNQLSIFVNFRNHHKGGIMAN